MGSPRAPGAPAGGPEQRAGCPWAAGPRGGRRVNPPAPTHPLSNSGSSDTEGESLTLRASQKNMICSSCCKTGQRGAGWPGPGARGEAAWGAAGPGRPLAGAESCAASAGKCQGSGLLQKESLGFSAFWQKPVAAPRGGSPGLPWGPLGSPTIRLGLPRFLPSDQEQMPSQRAPRSLREMLSQATGGSSRRLMRYF